MGCQRVENEDFQGVEISTPSGQTRKDYIIKLDTGKEMDSWKREKRLIFLVGVVLVFDMVAFATDLPPCHRTSRGSMGAKLLNFLKNVQF